MKNLLLLSFITIFIFACNNDSTNKSTSENNNETPKETSENTVSKSFVKYPFESGIVHYKNEMEGMSSTMTLYFKDYGKQQCIASETEMMGNKINTRAFEKDGYFYTLLMDQKRGGKMKINEGNDFGNINPFAFKEEYIKEVGAKKVSSETVIGRECDVYSFEKDDSNTKIWVWESLIVKIEEERNAMKMVIEVTKFEETDDLPDGIFDVPAGFTITEEQDIDESTEDFIDENAKG